MGLPCGTFNNTYQKDMSVVRTSMQWWLLAISLILTFTLPLWLPKIPVLGTEIVSLKVVNLMGIYIIAVLGLQIMMGYCGQLSIGHAAFMAVGAYTSGLLTSKLGLPFWIGLPCAAVGAGLVGIIFGAASLRLKGFYLVASTLAAQLVVLWCLNAWTSVTNADMGLPVPRPSIGSFIFNSDAKYFYIILACLLLGTFFARNLIRTRIGRAFIAIRDNELAANVMGIRLTNTKLLAFFIGCAYAGVAGALLAHWQGIAFPEFFNLWLSIWLIGYLIVGGIGTTVGPFFGVIVILLISNGLSWTVRTLGSPAFALTASDMIFGLIIILFIIFEPRGLAYRWSLFKTYYRLWPYSY